MTDRQYKRQKLKDNGLMYYLFFYLPCRRKERKEISGQNTKQQVIEKLSALIYDNNNPK